MQKFYYSADMFQQDVPKLAALLPEGQYDSIYGVPRGGIPLACALGQFLKLPLVEKPGLLTLVVDDIVDSGETRQFYIDNDFACLHFTGRSSATCFFLHKADCWIEYFWEKNEVPARSAITRILEVIGENPNREGLKETPDRVVRSFSELYSGYSANPDDLLKTFDSDGYSQLILVKDIEVYSCCEHHMLPFCGRAHVGYIPSGRVVGVSKIARLVDVYARRLQIQERLTEQITSCIEKWLQPVGVACVIEAQHFCMRMRGVGKQNSVMTTSSLKGIFLQNTDEGRAARAEFMGLIK